MKVLGIDFTSRPNRRKPITCLHCTLEGDCLHTGDLECLTDFNQFEDMLGRPGLWIAGIDFPFGQSRLFIESIGWPAYWEGYVLHAASLGKEGFRESLTAYRRNRAEGDKEHRRQTDIAAGSISPQKLYGVPVGLMFFEGTPRLIHSNVTIPHMRDGDPSRIVVEAYPGVLARNIIGRRSYKNDTKKKQTDGQNLARLEILTVIRSGKLSDHLGFFVEADDQIAEDPTGDHIDALLCAIQAAWAWQNRAHGFGAPELSDPLEGWIAHPSTLLC